MACYITKGEAKIHFDGIKVSLEKKTKIELLVDKNVVLTLCESDIMESGDTLTIHGLVGFMVMKVNPGGNHE